jgi:spore maturation protein CgeB
VSFVGLPTANRITQLGWLRLLGCRVTVRGHGWIGEATNPFQSPLSAGERLRRALRLRGLGEKLVRRLYWPMVRRQAAGPLTDAEMPDFLRDSFAVLGLNQGRDEHGRDYSYLKFRDLEFPGQGCCYVTEGNADVVAALEPGKEVVTYASMPEAAAALRELRRTPERATAIGRAGRRRVLADHGWTRRLQELAAAL